MDFAKLLAEFLTAFNTLKAQVPTIEALFKKLETEAVTEFTAQEAQLLTEFKAILANPRVAALLVEAKAVEASVLAEIEALIAKF